jgi:2-polyprenyl-6-methoxyphenol hydroxylase-like FAD-dependent oxidoreductase
MAERILIVGGGIAGLTLNRALGDGPYHVDLVERDAGTGRFGAAIAVQPNAMRVLHSLGVSDPVERAGSIIATLGYRDQDGAMLCEIDLDDLWSGVGSFVGITRPALHDALLWRPERCRFGTVVTSVRQRDGQVSVSLGDGTSADYDLVVGADGINSDVRWAAVDAGTCFAGQMAWRSVARVRPDGLDCVQFWLGEDRFFGLFPAGNGITYGVGNVSSERVREPVPGRKNRLLELFAAFGQPVQQYLAAIGGDGEIHCSPIEWLPAPAWHCGRVALIGDAAHAMSPMMGQGGCMAIEDAHVLAEELRSAGDIPAAIAAYQKRRGPRVEWVRQQSRALTELVRQPAVVRNTALRERGSSGFYDRFRPLVAAP